MIIDRNISKYIVFSEDSVINALRKINQNKERIIFCVSSRGVLEGVLTDGDFRRWLTAKNVGNLRNIFRFQLFEIRCQLVQLALR